MTTVDDLYGLPDDGRHYELVAGRVVSEPLPGARHGRVIARIARALQTFAEREGLAEVVAADSGFVLARDPDTVRGPDVAFVGRARYAAAGDPATAFPGAPDLAVEVLSPWDRPAEVHEKRASSRASMRGSATCADPQLPKRQRVLGVSEA